MTLAMAARCLLPSQMPGSRTTTPVAERAHGVCREAHPRLTPTRNRTTPGGPEWGLAPAGGREGGTWSPWRKGDMFPVA